VSSSSDSSPSSSAKPEKRVGLIGIGLDGNDGHKRITSGEKFVLVGGSAETHDRMTETTLKTFEELKRRDKHLETVDRKELAEIVHKVTPSK
jgi:hypothetical protein